MHLAKLTKVAENNDDDTVCEIDAKNVFLCYFSGPSHHRGCRLPFFAKISLLLTTLCHTLFSLVESELKLSLALPFIRLRYALLQESRFRVVRIPTGSVLVSDVELQILSI